MGLSSGGRGGGSVDTGGTYIRDSNWVTYLGGGGEYIWGALYTGERVNGGSPGDTS